MYQVSDGLDASGMAFVRELRLICEERRVAEAGGYTPPDSDPSKCEAVPPCTKGGFEFRLEEGGELFDRCDRIRCNVQEQCTALVQERLRGTGR